VKTAEQVLERACAKHGEFGYIPAGRTVVERISRMATEEEKFGESDLVPGHPYVVDPETGGRATLDGVSYASVDREKDLPVSDAAEEQLAQMEIPILAGKDNPNGYVFFAVLDGTGNDRHNMSEAPTGVAQIYGQLDSQIKAGFGGGHVAAAYITGAGTREYGDDAYDVVDGARGYTSDDRAETMYVEFCKQAAAWREKDPNAEISVASMGFSRGAEEAALFTRLVDERGIQDPRAIQYETGDGGLVVAGSVTFDRIPPPLDKVPPPLVEPGKVPQAAALVDPVPEGQLEYRDRRLAPSVVSAFQVTARDETRDQFAGSRHLLLGLSDESKSLNVIGPGAHADVGDGYYANGLGVRNTNLVKNYLNNLVDFETPLLTLKPEDTYIGKGGTNVIHDSEEHKSWAYSTNHFEEYGERNVRAELNTPEPPLPNARAGYVPVIPEEDTRREPMDTELAGSLKYRTATVASAPTGDLYDPKQEQEKGCSLVPPAIEVSSPASAPSESIYNSISTIRDTMCETGIFPVEKTVPEPPLETEIVEIKLPNGFVGLAPPPTERQRTESGMEVVGTLPMNTEAHPAFPMYGEVWNAMADPARTNIPWGSMSENDRSRAAAAVTAAAMEAPPPLNHINTVVLNNRNDTLIAIEGNPTDPASKRVSVPLETAVTTSVEASTKKADAVLEEQRQQALASPNNNLQPMVAPTTRAQ
jgi:hypothetical protein